MTRDKTIIVVGPEATGSRFCAKLAAHALGVALFGEWDGFRFAPDSGEQFKYINGSAVLHRSIPSKGDNNYVIEPTRFIEGADDIRFIFTTRDKSITSINRGYSKAEQERWIDENKKVIKSVIQRNVPYMFFSYETFMLYPDIYVKELYSFIGCECDYVPDIIDGNPKYMEGL